MESLRPRPSRQLSQKRSERKVIALNSSPAAVAKWIHFGPKLIVSIRFVAVAPYLAMPARLGRAYKYRSQE